MYFSLGFAAACGSCAYFLGEERRLLLAAVIGVMGILLCLSSRERKFGKRIAVVLLGCSVGLAWFVRYDSGYGVYAREMDGTEAVYSVRVSDFGVETAYGTAFDGTMVISGRTYRVKTYLNESIAVFPGDLVTGQMYLRVTLPDAMEESVYHQGKGIFLIAYQRGDISVWPYDVRWTDHIAELRLWIKSVLLDAFPEDTAPFAAALLLGDSGGLDYETDTDFKLSGIRHIIAVSGLHVSILFALVSTLTFRKRFLTALLGFPALFLFAALAGFSASVTRACIMSGLLLLAMLAEREYDGPTALSFAALVMLVVNPLVITDVGFQLSVGSVVGIYLFDPPMKKWLRSRFRESSEKWVTGNLVKWVCTSVSVTVSATVVTAPLCAMYFGTVSLVSILTNLLTLWVISFIFYGILLICLLAAIWPAAVSVCAAVISVPIRYVLTVAKILADFPLAAVYTRSPFIVLWLVFVYLLLGIFLVMKKKRPGVLISCGTLGLCVALLASWMEPELLDFRFTVLDVGQGQCLLVQCKGVNIMVDCGGDSDTETADIAAETLLSQGITELDCLILTHLDRDHAGAAANLLTRIDTGLLILPPEANGLEACTSGQVVYAGEDLSIDCKDMQVEIYAANFPGNSNEMSLCILFDTQMCDILITGDRNGFGERTLLRYHAIADVDILVAGHHGSKNSTCEELLEAVRPEIVCVSAGEGNAYGHPAPELLQRLQEFGCTVFRSDEDGDIVIRR